MVAVTRRMREYLRAGILNFIAESEEGLMGGEAYRAGTPRCRHDKDARDVPPGVKAVPVDPDMDR